MVNILNIYIYIPVSTDKKHKVNILIVNENLVAIGEDSGKETTY